MPAKRPFSVQLTDGTRIEVVATNGHRAMAVAKEQIKDSKPGVGVVSAIIEIAI